MANSVTFEDGECRMCGCYTNAVVNIKLEAVTICESCCNLVTKQHVADLINKEIPRLHKCIKDQRDDYYGKPTKDALLGADVKW